MPGRYHLKSGFSTYLELILGKAELFYMSTLSMCLRLIAVSREPAGEQTSDQVGCDLIVAVEL